MDLNSIEREKRDNLKNLQEKRDFRISLLIRSNVSNDVTSKKIIYLLKILFIYCTSFIGKNFAIQQILKIAVARSYYKVLKFTAL